MTFSRIVGDRILFSVAGIPLLICWVCETGNLPLAQPPVSFQRVSTAQSAC